jgi:hypothetical protein
MVEIRFPPPTRNISPKFKTLKPGTVIRRIFDLTSYQATATGFRYFGPLSRFDHQQRQKSKPVLSSDRGIIYAGFSLSCCLIEIFGDEGTIEIKDQQIADITLKQELTLLDLRDSGAWDAGSVASMSSDGMRKLTQSWSNYFYENPKLYGQIDGLIFNNAHNGEEAIALYERAKAQLESADISIINLNDPVLIESIYAIAQKLNLLVEVDKL